MEKFRNNIFYICSLFGFILWIVNTVAVMQICGMTHFILVREIFFLGVMIFVFFSHAQKVWFDIETTPFNGRAEISKGDVLFVRFFGPWFILLTQIMFTFIIGGFTYTNVMGLETSEKVCAYRSRYR